jgi:predicted aspartyl protease
MAAQNLDERIDTMFASIIILPRNVARKVATCSVEVDCRKSQSKVRIKIVKAACNPRFGRPRWVRVCSAGKAITINKESR